jgi:hypothetical protein
VSGKGSSPRPYSVTLKTFDSNWDKIFNKPDPRTVQDAENEDEAFKLIEQSQVKDSDQGG